MRHHSVGFRPNCLDNGLPACDRGACAGFTLKTAALFNRLFDGLCWRRPRRKLFWSTSTGWPQRAAWPRRLLDNSTAPQTLGSGWYAFPLLDLPLTFQCLSTAFSMPFPDYPLPSADFSMPFHYLFNAFQLPFTQEDRGVRRGSGQDHVKCAPVCVQAVADGTTARDDDETAMAGREPAESRHVRRAREAKL